MTKKELLKELDGISTTADDLIGVLNDALKVAKGLLNKIENLPAEENEITEEKEDNE